MLHDPGGAFAAQDALVDRVILVAFDVPDLATLQVNLDAATAGTHVACGRLDLVAGIGRQVDAFFRGQEIAWHGVVQIQSVVARSGRCRKD